MTLPAWIRDLESVRGPALFITRNNLALVAQLGREAKGLDWTVRTKDDLKRVSAGGLLALLRSRRWSALLIEDRAEDMPRRRDLYRSLLAAGRSGVRLLLTTEDGTTRAEPVHRWRSAASLIAALAAEGVTTLGGLSSASRLTRALCTRRGSTSSAGRPGSRAGAGPVAVAPEVGGAPLGTRIAVIKTEFWFGLKAGGSVSHGVGVLAAMRRLGLEPRLWTTSVLPGAPPEILQTEVRPALRPSLIEEAAMAAFNRTFLDQRRGRRARVSSLGHLPPARRVQPGRAGVGAAPRCAARIGSERERSLGARGLEPALLRRPGPAAWSASRSSRADRLVLISEELIPTVESLGGDRARMVVNPNGVDVDRFDPESRGDDVRRAVGVRARRHRLRLRGAPSTAGTASCSWPSSSPRS